MDLRALLVKHEGLKYTSYADTKGFPTNGIGCRCDTLGTTWSEAQVNEAYAAHLHDILSELRTHAFWFLALDLVRQAVILDVAWNVGTHGMLKFIHMIAALKERDWDTAANELLDSDAARELPRRYGELAMMLRTGEWPA